MWQFIKGIDGWVIAGWWHNIVSFCIHPTKTSAVIYGAIIFSQFLLVKDDCRVLAMRESIVNWNEDKAPFPLEVANNIQWCMTLTDMGLTECMGLTEKSATTELFM